MRTLINVRDVLSEYQKTLDCPHCGGATLVVQAMLDMRKGRMFISRKGYCTTHGLISETKIVKTIQMCGGDAQVLPHADDPQALADEKGGVHDP